MHNLNFALQGAWKVLLTGLALGAGLPLIFALGIRSLAWGACGTAEVSGAKADPSGTMPGWCCFLLVLAGVALGIPYIVPTGCCKQLSFERIYPPIIDKNWASALSAVRSSFLPRAIEWRRAGYPAAVPRGDYVALL